eukprot:s1184_g37.t1
MSVVDSEAVFASRARAIGISEDVITLFKNGGIATLGNLAFSSSYVPGSSDDSSFVELVKKVLGRDGTIGEMSKIRRIFNEAYAATSAEMRTLVEQNDETPTRKLAPAERAERFSAQQKRLKGILMAGNLEPGDSLVDAAVSLYESDRLRYLSWDSCVSREHEILTASKRDLSLTFDSSGNLKMSKKEQVTPCEVSSELHIKYCLTRRGLALEQGNVLAFDLHELWAEKLLTCRLTDPPAGYSRVTFKQMQLADAKLFVVLGEKTRKGIKILGDGRPCDKVFKDAMNSPEVQHLLQPMPQAASSSPKTSDKSGAPPIKRTIDKVGSPKGSGKKGKSGKTWKPSVPQELLSMGCVGVTNKGNALCYDYQLGKCSLPVQNSRCSKGLHLARRKVPQLVSEFAAIHSVMLPQVPPVNNKRLITSPVLHIPAGAKLLRTEAKRGKDGQVMCVFGIFRSCQQFVHAAQCLSHPFDDFLNVPDILLKCMFDILTMGPVGISKYRIQKLLTWRDMRVELEQKERELHNDIPAHLQSLVQDKQFLLLEKLAAGIKWPDTALHREMREGFKLVGSGTQSGVFKSEVKHATLSEEQLMAKAKFLKPLILGRIANSGGFEHLSELHEITLGEAGEKRWLEGPLSAE